jgi:hypothetical protein
MATAPLPHVLDEIQRALRSNEGNLGVVFRLLESGLTSQSEMVAEGGIANTGHASNLIRYIKSIIQGNIPASPTRAEAAGRTIGGLIRTFEFSPETRLYLQDLRSDLDEYSTNASAVRLENSQLEKQSETLATIAEQTGGVYVYTFPAYKRTPAKTDPDRYWLKVGMTDRIVEMRIADQTRSTAMPEDPLVLRVYRSVSASNSELEKKFHRILQSAGHNRTEARHGGKEWYATNLEFLDEIAGTLGLDIQGNEFPS